MEGLTQNALGAGRRERAMGGERFSYRVTKDGKVFVYWHGGQGKREIVIEGARAKKLIAESPGMDREGEQLALARITGIFKRGKSGPVGSLSVVRRCSGSVRAARGRGSTAGRPRSGWSSPAVLLAPSRRYRSR